MFNNYTMLNLRGIMYITINHIMNSKLLLFISFIFCLGGTSYAQLTWTNGNSNGSWSDGANWDAVADPPSITDAVIFDGTVSNDDCTIDIAEAQCLSITIRNNYTGTITIDNGIELNVDGSISVLASGFSGSFVVNSSGSLETIGTLSVNATGNSSANFTINGSVIIGGQLAMNVGTLNAGGASLFQINGSSCNLSNSNFTAPSGTMVISGSLSRSTGGSFNANGGTLSLAANGNRSISANFTGTNSLNNLTLSTTAAPRTITIKGTVSVNGNLTIATSNTNGLTLDSNQINVSGNLDISGNIGSGGTGGSTTINLIGGTSQSITGNSSNDPDGMLPNVTINQASGGSISFTNRVNFGRNLTITSNGSFTANSGSTIAFVGTSNASTLAGTTTLTNIDIPNLIIDKSTQSLTISGTFTPNIRVTGVLTVTSGTLNTNGKIVFRSISANTSGQLTTVGGTISGNVTVERFIPGSTGRKWRFLASPVTTSNFISNNWQQQIHITGSGTGGTTCPSLTANSNGFDATTQNTPSFYTYSESGNAWSSIASTSGVNLVPGTGYRVFIRGNRSQGCSLLDGTNPTPNDVTLSATGTLATGTQTINVTNGAGSGWNLVGNPFQAIIDWDNISRSSVGATYYIFNPNAGLGGVGAYGNYTAGGSGTNGASRYIGPGHSFWVQASGAGSIIIEEADKAVTQTGSATTVFKTSAQNGISIKILDAQNYSDEVLVTFSNSASKCADTSLDAEKLQFNQGVGNIATFNSCSPMRYSINTLTEYNATSIDTIGVHIKVATNTSANYRLSFDGLTNIPSNLDVYLVDAYTNTYFNLKNSSIYNFSTIANNAATQGANRFKVIIGTGLSALPVKLTNFTAARNGNTSKLVWNTASELNSKLFIIERSEDASTYKEVGVVNAKGNSSVTSSYTFNDLSPVLATNNYYRLKAVDKDGKFEYSNIQIVSFEDNVEKNTAIATNIYPMPAEDHVMLTIGNDVSGDINYAVYDVAGNIVSEAVNMPVQANGDLRINLAPSLIGGFYIIELTDDFGNVQRVKFVKK